ncbi:hypothetical protein VCV18_003255 [Metarhizium anisopliae]
MLRVAVRLNNDGTLTLFSESAHEIGLRATTELRMLTIQSNTSIGIMDEDGIHDANWISGTRGELVYLTVS